jgi:hypothetical protein
MEQRNPRPCSLPYQVKLGERVGLALLNSSNVFESRLRVWLAAHLWGPLSGHDKISLDLPLILLLRSRSCRRAIEQQTQPVVRSRHSILVP